MKIVLDTNVFVSGIFFTGPPHRILNAWRDGRVRIVYSSAIFREYERVLIELSGKFARIDGRPFLHLLSRYGELVQPAAMKGISCRDPEDIKFIECSLQSRARCLVTGDKDLLEAKVRAVLILTPRQFCDQYL
jgi:putative PIN family toxin of toxin-antitoxin system